MILNHNRFEFITTLLKLNNYKTYLELGIYTGNNIERVCKMKNVKCWGVDVKKNFTSNLDFNFFEGTTDNFFKQNNLTFDMIFIDACHRLPFVERDIDNSLKVLNQNGLILLHDIDPSKEELIDDIGLDFCSNAYGIIKKIYNMPELNIIVLPIDETGIALVNRKKDRRVLKFRENEI